MSAASDVARFARSTKIRMDKVCRKTALDMGRSLVIGNPVDTGYSRSNWFIGNTRDGGLDPTLSKSGSPSLGRISAFASGFTPGGVFYFINNVVYIMTLEFGHSQQAPHGWVRATVARFQEIVNQAVAEVAQ
jgi:hypothetical protein